MEPNKGEESGEMYSPDNQGEYTPESGIHNFSIQGLSDTLTTLESEVTVVHPPSEEYALMMEVTMAYHPRCPCPPTFSWNTGMVMHWNMCKWMALAWHTCSSSSISRATEDLSIMPLNLSERMCQRHFLSGNSHSAHFAIIPLPLAEGWHWAVTASERRHQRSRAEYQDHPMHNLISSKSDSTLQLVGNAPTSMVVWTKLRKQEVAAPLECPFLN